MGYRAAIIGCGMFAGRFEDFSAPRTYSHAKGYVKNGAFTDLGFYDPHEDRREDLAAKAGGRAFASLDEMLDELAPDVVSICVPDDQHFATLMRVLGHPKPPALIFCEKPVCETAGELDQLTAASDRAGVPVIVNHSRRFDTMHRGVRDLIRSGGLGKLVQGHVDYYGGWSHLGVHVVDILQYFFATTLEPKALSYYCESRYPSDPTLDVEADIGGARIRFSGFHEPFYQILDISLMFEKGQIKLTDFGQRVDVLRKTVNAENENVLVPDAALSGVGMTDPMPNAIALITKYLETRDTSVLDDYGLAQAQKTMTTLWRGREIYAAQLEQS